MEASTHFLVVFEHNMQWVIQLLPCYYVYVDTGITLVWQISCLLLTVDWWVGGCFTEWPHWVFPQTLPCLNWKYSSVACMLSAWLSLLSSQSAILKVGPNLHCIVWCLFKRAACASRRMWHMATNGMHQWHAGRIARSFSPSFLPAKLC